MRLCPKYTRAKEEGRQGSGSLISTFLMRCCRPRELVSAASGGMDGGRFGLPCATRGWQVREDTGVVAAKVRVEAWGLTAAAGVASRSLIGKPKRKTLIKVTGERKKTTPIKGSGKRLSKAAGQHDQRPNRRYGRRGPRR